MKILWLFSSSSLSSSSSSSVSVFQFLLFLLVQSQLSIILAQQLPPRIPPVPRIPQPHLPVSQSQPSICDANKCRCTPAKDDGNDNNMIVDCSARQLTTFPSTGVLPKRTTVLDMRQNMLQHLDKLEKNDDLTHLTLAVNELSSIDQYAFEQTTKLVMLDLSYNQLKTLPDTLFTGLDELQSLNLSHNRFEYLPKTLFESCAYLVELRLSHNPLKQINTEMFFYLHQLEILDLAHNEIYSLQSTTFHSMSKLDSLDLSGNDFDAIPIDALRGVRQLTTLDMSENSIKELNEASLYKLHSLRVLRMNKMPLLVEVKRKAFSTQYNLQQLIMDDNPHLSYIHPQAFYGAFNHSWIALRTVSLRRNSLHTLNEKTLPFCNLTSLDITFNPWHCDCRLHWIKYCEQQKPNFQRGLMCSLPDNLRGHLIEDIEHKDLVCQRPLSQQAHTLFSVAIIFLLLMFATMIVFFYRERLSNYYGTNRTHKGSIYYVRAQSENE